MRGQWSHVLLTNQRWFIDQQGLIVGQLYASPTPGLRHGASPHLCLTLFSSFFVFFTASRCSWILQCNHITPNSQTWIWSLKVHVPAPSHDWCVRWLGPPWKDALWRWWCITLLWLVEKKRDDSLNCVFDCPPPRHRYNICSLYVPTYLLPFAYNSDR